MMERNHRNQNHIVKLCLAPEIRSAVIKVMAKHDLDKEYACLLLITKQLYQDQLIPREVYEIYAQRYSRKLARETIPVLTPQQLKEKQTLDEKTRRFSWMLTQWRFQDTLQREKWIAEAEAWKDRVSNASLVLDLGRKS